MKRQISMALLGLSVWGLGSALQAQTLPTAEPAQVVNLSASAHKEVPQDWLTVVVRASLEGSEPAALQTQLKTVVEQALAQLRPQMQPQAFEVHSGHFGIYPRHNDKGRVVGWQGQADLVIEGRDFVKVSQVAAQVPRMAVAQATFSLSRDGRQQLEAEVQGQAVQKFRQRAQQLAKDFGFSTYTLRQVSVGSADRAEPLLQARALLADVAMAAPAPAIPLAAGKDEVRITVSGSIQLR